MEHLHTDVLVIGWGKGGKTLARTLGRAGREVTLVEASAEMVGGTCINIGCVPTKALVTSASRRRDHDDEDQWFSQAIEGRDALVAKLRAANYAMLATVDAVRLVSGRATFLGPKRILVSAGEDELEISADVVLINTGTVPNRPPIDGLEDSRVFDSTTIQHADPRPENLVVVGAGPIGLEFAGMFRDFGAEVAVINSRPVLLPNEDRDVATAVESVLADAGVQFLHGSRAAEIKRLNPNRLSVKLASGATVEGDAVLVASGRVPATEGLGLDAAGVETDDRGFIRVDEYLRTSAEHVWAIGDVHGGPQQTYLSLDDSRIIGAQLTATNEGAAEDPATEHRATGDRATGDRATQDRVTGDRATDARTTGGRSTADRVAVPTTVFTTPPFAAVGMTEAEAREAGHRILVAKKEVASIAAAPRPKIVGDPRGMVKFVVDADTDLILGARLLVVDAQELVNLVALAMRAGVTASDLRNGIWTHPSTTELLNEVLAELGPA